MKHIENFGEYSVKNVKNFMGRDAYGYNANLYRGKTKVAFVIDDGNGGEPMIDWTSRNTEEQQLLDKHCASLPPLDSGYEGMSPLEVDAELFIGELISNLIQEKDIKKLRRDCETKTLYRSKKDGYGQYAVIKHVIDDKVRQHLKTKYGEDVEIFNDVLAQGKIPSVFALDN